MAKKNKRTRRYTCAQCGITRTYRGKRRRKFCCKCRKLRRSKSRREYRLQAGIRSTTYRAVCLAVWSKRCACCTSIKRVEVHHIDMDHMNDLVTNLVPLCRACHRMVHAAHKKHKLSPMEALERIWPSAVQVLASKFAQAY